jgi:hypothetical protein
MRAFLLDHGRGDGAYIRLHVIAIPLVAVGRAMQAQPIIDDAPSRGAFQQQAARGESGGHTLLQA